MGSEIIEMWHGNIVTQSDSRNNSPEMKHRKVYEIGLKFSLKNRL